MAFLLNWGILKNLSLYIIVNILLIDAKDVNQPKLSSRQRGKFPYVLRTIPIAKSSFLHLTALLEGESQGEE
jgi:hypothetical protein